MQTSSHKWSLEQQIFQQATQRISFTDNVIYITHVDSLIVITIKVSKQYFKNPAYPTQPLDILFWKLHKNSILLNFTSQDYQ